MPTLYEDWIVRRERLVVSDPRVLDADEQTRVFDYLLSQYRDDPRVQEEARYPLPSEATLNTRAILVHHHTAIREFGGPRTAMESHRRTRIILKRISAINPQAAICAPGSRNNPEEPDDEELCVLRGTTAEVAMNEVGAAPFAEAKPRGCWSQLMRLFPMPFLLTKDALAALPSALSESNPEWVEWLCLLALNNWPEKFRPVLRDDVIDAMIALALDSDGKGLTRRSAAIWSVLERNNNYSVLQGCIRECVFAGGTSLKSDSVRGFLVRYKRHAAENVRMCLTDSRPVIRARAADLLGEIGDLHDIGLFHDLLATPESVTGTREREAYLRAIERLSGVEWMGGNSSRANSSTR